MRLLISICIVVLAGCSGGGGGGTGGGTGTAGSSATGGGSSATGGGSGTAGSSATGGGTATAGGSGSTAGGSGSTAGGSGSTAGGSGSTAGGSGSTGGITTFLRVGMFSQFYAAGSDGRIHQIFDEGAAERVFYGSCISNCNSPTAWNPVQIASTATQGTTVVGPEGIGIDSTGRLHALITGVPPLGSGNANRMAYFTCANNCGVAASWTKLDLTSLASEDPIGTRDTFMVAANGTVSFMTAGNRGSGDAWFVTCSSNCTSLASWSSGQVLTGMPYFAQRDSSGVTHVMYNGGTSMGDNLLNYARCASNCTTRASWQTSMLGFILRTATYESGFAVTPSGKVYVAYNQGVAVTSTTDNRKLLINSCQTPNNCMDLNTWASFSLGALDEGDDGLWLEPDGEGLGLATTASFDLNARQCSANCGTAAGWSASVTLDSSAAVAQVIAPATGSSCPSTSESAAWWPNDPTVAIGPNGFILAHSPYAIVKCPGSNPSRLPPIGRLYSSF